MLSCEERLYDLHQVLGSSGAKIELHGDRGKVSNVVLDPFTNSYSEECFSRECFELPGVWSDYRVVPLLQSSPLYEDCFEPGVYLPCTPVSKVEVLVAQPACYSEGCTDAYGTVWTKETRYVSPPDGQPCFPPDDLSPENVEPNWEPYLYGASWGRYYNNPELVLMPIYVPEAYEEGVFAPIIPSGPREYLAVDSFGPYEEGVCERRVYYGATFLYSRQNDNACYDECTSVGWELLGVWDCLPTGRQNTLLSLCGSPNLAREIFQPGLVTIGDMVLEAIACIPYGEDAFDPYTYTDSVFLWGTYIPTGEKSLLAYSYLYDGQRVFSVYPGTPLAFQDILSYAIAEYTPGCKPSCYDLGVKGLSAIVYSLLEECFPEGYIVLATPEGCNPFIVGGYWFRWVYRNGKWQGQFFIEGAGSDGIAYNLEAGYLHPLCPNDPVIVEDNIPLMPNGEFRVPANLELKGVPYIRLKAYSLYGFVTVAEYAGNVPLPRTYAAGLLNRHQSWTYIKDTCVALILLLLSPYYPEAACEGEYGWRPPHFFAYVRGVLLHLVSLVNKANGLGNGSIPYKVYSHSRYESLYNPPPECPSTYLPGVFSSNCMEDYFWGDNFLWVGDELPGRDCNSCFEAGEVHPSLEDIVDPEAVAWLLYACGVFSHLQRHKDILAAMPLMASYLNSLVQPSIGLLDAPTSANLMSVIAYMKAYDILSDPYYLELAADLHLAASERLYVPTERRFANSYGDTTSNLDTSITSLFYAWQVGRSDIVESILTSLSCKGYPKCPPAVGVSVREGQVKLSPLKHLMVRRTPDRVLPFDGVTASPIVSWALLYPTVNALTRDEYRIPFLPLVESHSLRFPFIKDAEGLLSYALCLSDRTVGYDAYITRVHCLPQLETVCFHRAYVYDRLKQMWPVDFQTWATSSSLTLKGTIGKTLSATAVTLATWYGWLMTNLNGVYLQSSVASQLDKWGEDLSLPRFTGEGDEQYKERLSYVMSGKDDSRSGDIVALSSHLGFFNPGISYPAIQGTLSSAHPIQPFTPLLGAYLQGERAVASSFDLTFYGNLSLYEGERLARSAAAGTWMGIVDCVYLGECHTTDLTYLDSASAYMDAFIDWDGSSIPTVTGEPYCCAVGVHCRQPTLLTLSHPSNAALYVWSDSDGYKAGMSPPDGVNPIAFLPAGETRKVVII